MDCFPLSFEHFCWTNWFCQSTWDINPFPNKPLFLCVCHTSLLKSLHEKKKLLIRKQFFLFPQCFLPLWGTLHHFCQIHNCRMQTLSVWKSLKYVKRVKSQLVRGFSFSGSIKVRIMLHV